MNEKFRKHIIMDGFPEFGDFQDYNGKQVRFRYVYHDAGNIFTLRAYEDNKGEVSREFCVYDHINPANNLYKIRQIIKKELNTRYFSDSEHDEFSDMNFDYFKGNITNDNENELCIVVDGKKMSMTDLENLIDSHQGFEIEIRIIDGST